MDSGRVKENVKRRWERYRESPIRHFLDIIFLPWRIIVFLFSSGIGIALLLIFALFVIIFIPVIFIGSGTSNVWAQEAISTVENSKIVGPIVRGARDFFSKVSSPERFVQMQEEFTWKATIDENVGNKDLGLKFEDFKAQPNVFYYNEGDSNIEDKIDTFGTGTVTSLEDSEIVFDCDADDGKIKGEVKNPIGPIEFDRGLNFFTVECQYNGEDFELSGKAQQGYTLRLKADYGFSGMGYLNVYTIGGDVLERELRKSKGNKNVIFANVRDDEHLDKETGEVEPTYSGGPVKLILFYSYNQPFTEKGLGSNPYYTIQIILERDNWWDGTLKEIKDIYFYTPEGIEIEEGEESKFEHIGEDDYQFKIYRLKREEIDDLNNRCLDEFDVFDLNCWSGSNIATSVRLIVNDVNDELSETYIWAKVDYEYETEIKEVARFIKQTDLIA